MIWYTQPLANWVLLLGIQPKFCARAYKGKNKLTSEKAQRVPYVFLSL